MINKIYEIICDTCYCAIDYSHANSKKEAIGEVKGDKEIICQGNKHYCCESLMLENCR